MNKKSFNETTDYVKQEDSVPRGANQACKLELSDESDLSFISSRVSTPDPDLSIEIQEGTIRPTKATVMMCNVQNLSALIHLADVFSGIGTLHLYDKFFRTYVPKALAKSCNVGKHARLWKVSFLVTIPDIVGPLFSLTKHFSQSGFSNWLSIITRADALAINTSISLHLTSAKEVVNGDGVELQGLFTIEHKHTLDPNTERLVSEAMNTLQPVTNTINATKSLVDSMHSGIADTYGSAQNAMSFASDYLGGLFEGDLHKVVIPIVGPALLVFCAYRMKTSRIYYVLFIFLFAKLFNDESFQSKCAKTFFFGCLGVLVESFTASAADAVDTQNESIELQAGVEIGSTIFSYLLALYNSFGYESENLEALRDIYSKKKTITGFVDEILEWSKTIINVVSSKLFGFRLFTPELVGFELLEQEYETMIKGFANGSLHRTPSNANRLSDLKAQYKEIVLKNGGKPNQRAVYNFSLMRYKEIEKVLDAMQGFLVDPRGFRQEPVSICLVGEPGTKKTVLSQAIVDQCLKISLSGVTDMSKVLEEKTSYVFARGINEYWDGIGKRTEVTVWDDFGQLRDSVGSPNINFLDLINAYNTAPFALNMSAVEDKGKYFFKSRWIVLTTNMNKFECNSLISTEALKRRIDLKIKPQPISKYRRQDGSLNIDHPDIKTNTEGYFDLSLSKFEFKILDTHSMFRGTKFVQGAIISAEELIEMLRSLYNLKETIYNNESRRQFRDYYSDIFSGSCHSTGFSEEILQDTGIILQSGIDRKRFEDYTHRIDEDKLFAPNEESELGLLEWEETFLDWNGEDYAIIHHGLKSHLMKKYEDYVLIMTGAQERDVAPFFRLFTAFVAYGGLRDPSTCYLVFRDGGYKALMEYYNNNLAPLEKVQIKIKTWKEAVTHHCSRITGNSLAQRLVLGLVVAGVSYSLWPTFKATLAGLISLFGPEVEQQGNYMAAKVNKPKTKEAIRRSKATKVSLQGGDINAINVSQSLNKNVFDLSYVNDEVEINMGSVVFINSSDILMPLHFLDKYREGVDSYGDLKVILNKGEFFRELDGSVFFANMAVMNDNGEHLLMVEVPSLAFKKKDILKNFVTDEDVQCMLSSGLSVMVYLNSQGKRAFLSEARLDKLDFKVLKMSRGIHYIADSVQGDCGVPLYVRDTRLQARRIVGIHVAGTARAYSVRNAYAGIVTQQMISELQETLRPGPMDEEAVLQNGSLSLIKKIGSAQHNHTPYATSRIVRSPLARTDFPVPSKIPAKCYVHDDIDPLKIALSKYYHRPINYDASVLEESTMDLKITLSPSEDYHTEDIIPFREALYGNPLIANRTSIPTSTSAGYPLKFTDKKIKNRILPLGEDNDHQTYTNLESECFKIIEDANQGYRHDFIYCLSLKDEVLPFVKVLDGKARPFCGTPLALFIVTKMLFGQFVEFFFTNCLDKENASTLNQYEAWHALYLKITSLYEDRSKAKVDSADYSAFDASNNPVVMLKALEVIQNWYEVQGLTKYAEARHTIFLEVINAKITFLGDIYEMQGSLPSGSYLTLVVNCLTNMLLLRYSYFSLVPREVRSATFNKDVVLVVLGDDNIYSAKEEISEIFTPLLISQKVAELGFQMTSDTKGDLGGWRDITTVSFLKRTFVWCGPLGKYMGALSLETLMSTPYWSKKGPLYTKIFVDCVNFFYRELSLHSPAIWEKYVHIMYNSLRQLGDVLLERPDFHNLNQSFWRDQVLHSPVFLCDY